MSTPTAPVDPTRRAREAAVLERAEAFALGHAGSEQQRRLLGVALAGLREQTEGAGKPPAYIHLAPLVFCGLWGDDTGAQPLAAATALLFAGLDLLDNLADGDLPARWAGYRPAQITLTAATFLCALPQLAIAALDAPPSVVAAMHQTLAEGLLAMAAGHGTDLALAGAADPEPETVEAAVAAKSGEEVALFAALGAQLAGASPRVVAACRQMGCALGAGGQLASDCHDLFFAPWSRDMASGARTLPIALHLARLRGRDRDAFLALLEEARTDSTAQGMVRSRLRAAGELRRCAFTVEVYCQRARRMLAEAGLLEPARSRIQAMIAGIAMCRKRSGEEHET